MTATTTKPELFTREGVPCAGAISHTDTGRPCYSFVPTCSRCGGAGGADKWAATGWTCFACGGTGNARTVKTVRLYTAAELAVLNGRASRKAEAKAAQDAAQAAQDAAERAARSTAFLSAHGALLAAAEPYCERSEFVRDVVRKARERAEISEAQATALRAAVERFASEDARKARSEFVGAIGERIKIAVTVERVASYQRASFATGRPETVHVVTFRTADGAAIVSKSPAFVAEKGEAFTLAGTVKEHSSYNGEAQTIVQRCAVVDERKERASS